MKKNPAEIEIPNFKDIDARQQKRWEQEKLFKTPGKPMGKKFYCLDMFPYPSGEGLHVGHPEGYTASDIIARYKRMCGFQVLHPIGWDAFGLPAENYAINSGVHPEETTRRNIATFKRQIKSLGFSYDFDREISTTDPNYYKWTQWIFLKLFKRGLAYESTVPINWCPSCKTGLANEEVFQGKCERCQTTIEKKNLRQWMLKITAYAERLLSDLKEVDWPASTILMQKNWIGRSEGAEIHFPVNGHVLNVFTTRPDTIYGATYMVISPEHPLAMTITAPDKRKEVTEYIKESQKRSDLERTQLAREKTGIFIGSYALNPVNNERIPVWMADYVLMSYGTGAIMAVPAHDERDWEFAKKFNLPIKQVVKPEKGFNENSAFCGEGISINSPLINNLRTPEAKKKIIEFLSSKGCGKAKVNYKLRDWVFSRQRYWGEPIPIIHCPKCGAVPVPEKELPLILPELKKYEPSGTGESPLANAVEWLQTKCPHCQTPSKRETNTMPQWAGSCWYYLRFIDPKNKKEFVNKELENAWMPVDLYIGGSEHAVLHLLYARFWHKVLYDEGLVSTKEPFKKLVHQGMILSYAYRDSQGIYRKYSELKFGEKGKAILKTTGEKINPVVEKMSKSRKNVVNPDEILAKYGADTFRMYEMFMGPLEMTKPWDMQAIEGIYRFVKKIWKWGIQKTEEFKKGAKESSDKDLIILRHQTIKKVTQDIENLKFNTAISALMVHLNKLSNCRHSEEDFNIFLSLLHPFAPHITDEIWARNGKADSLLLSPWPTADENILSERVIEIPVQVNGKIRAKIHTKETIDDENLKEMAKKSVEKYTNGKHIAKIIIVPKRLVSIVVK